MLSASADCSVRLWSPARPDCLALFTHSDIVTSVAFHPQDDRKFISGCFDCRVRLWSIEDRKVLGWNELPAENIVTAVAWSNDGKYALVGSSTGVLLFFDIDGFKYYTQLLVKSTRGKNSVGKKISSIALKPNIGTLKDQVILVSSNDSRLRSYSLRDKTNICKYIGHRNDTAQISASFSDDACLIISGGEDGKCTVWAAEQTKWSLMPTSKDKRCESYEYFHASSNSPCTCAIFTPSTLVTKLQEGQLRPVDGEEILQFHRLIITADTEGRIRIFENYPALLNFLGPT